MKPFTRLVPSGLLLALAASPALAQEKSDRSYQWYWGAQVGEREEKKKGEGKEGEKRRGEKGGIKKRRKEM